MPRTLLPEWSLQYLVPEYRFEAAFEAVSLQQKSRLKKCIAVLHAWYGQPRIRAWTTENNHQQGLQSRHRQRPLDWVLVKVDQNVASPALVLATVLPPVLAGVGEVIVSRVRGNGSFPDALLTALELSGLETVINCPGQADQALLRELSASSSRGAVVFLSEAGEKGSGRGPMTWTMGGIPGYTLTGPARGGLWSDDPAQWDLEALHFAHPNLQVTLWSESPCSLPVSWPQQQGTVQDFSQAGYDVLFLPRERLETCFGRAPLVLCPGQESSFVWPGFYRELFVSSSVAWWDPFEESAALES